MYVQFCNEAKSYAYWLVNETETKPRHLIFSRRRDRDWDIPTFPRDRDVWKVCLETVSRPRLHPCHSEPVTIRNFNHCCLILPVNTGINETLMAGNIPIGQLWVLFPSGVNGAIRAISVITWANLARVTSISDSQTSLHKTHKSIIVIIIICISIQPQSHTAHVKTL